MILRSLEERLEVKGNEVPPRQSDKVRTKKWQIVFEIREDDQVEDLQRRTTLQKSILETSNRPKEVRKEERGSKRGEHET